MQAWMKYVYTCMQPHIFRAMHVWFRWICTNATANIDYIAIYIQRHFEVTSLHGKALIPIACRICRWQNLRRSLANTHNVMRLLPCLLLRRIPLITLAFRFIATSKWMDYKLDDEKWNWRRNQQKIETKKQHWRQFAFAACGHTIKFLRIGTFQQENNLSGHVYMF